MTAGLASECWASCQPPARENTVRPQDFLLIIQQAQEDLKVAQELPLAQINVDGFAALAALLVAWATGTEAKVPGRIGARIAVFVVALAVLLAVTGWLFGDLLSLWLALPTSLINRKPGKQPDEERRVQGAGAQKQSPGREAVPADRRRQRHEDGPRHYRRREVPPALNVRRRTDVRGGDADDAEQRPGEHGHSPLSVWSTPLSTFVLRTSLDNLALAVVAVWIYQRSRGSLLPVLVLLIETSVVAWAVFALSAPRFYPSGWLDLMVAGLHCAFALGLLLQGRMWRRPMEMPQTRSDAKGRGA